MADVKVRNLDDAVVATLRRDAEAAGHSLEQELRLIITAEHRRRRAALLADVLAHQAGAPQHAADSRGPGPARVIVVDASVAAKWIMVEPGTPAANELLAGDDLLLAPDLAAVEVAAAITRKGRLGELEAGEAARLVGIWRSWLDRGVVALVSSTELIELAADWAIRLHHPLQDCLYLALAARHQVELVTADQAFLRRIGNSYPRSRALVTVA
jgi:predicted nucleic acid-binding protein/plasmid stability protein